MPDNTPAAQGLAERAVGALYGQDAASQALGIRIAEIRPDFIRATMVVRPDMVNGHDLCHGGLILPSRIARSRSAATPATP
jgi:acyl-CoA thioesterase